MTNNVDYVHNQPYWLKNDDNKLWKILLDSQSTPNVIINKHLLTNFRKFKWKLRLQTYAGECSIDKIGQIRGVGIVWYYLKGVANILSQFMMALHGVWDIEYSTKTFNKTGIIEDLCFNVMKEEGFKCTFDPTSKGLHVHASDKSDCGNMFSSEGLEKNSNGVDGTFCAILGTDVDESSEDNLITGVEIKEDHNKINNATYE